MYSRPNDRLVVLFDVLLVILEVSQVRLPRHFDEHVEIELAVLVLAAAAKSRPPRGGGTESVLLLLQVLLLESPRLS